MTELNLPWRISNAHGLCVVDSDGRIVADLTPRTDWIDPHDSVQLEAYAEHIVAVMNRTGYNELDLTDPDVREMARFNHRPRERWAVSAGGRGFLQGVLCDTCHNAWPCPTVIDLRHTGRYPQR